MSVNCGVNHVPRWRVGEPGPAVGHVVENVNVSFEFFVNETGEFKRQTVESALTFVLGDEGFEFFDAGCGKVRVVEGGTDFRPGGVKLVFRV